MGRRREMKMETMMEEKMKKAAKSRKLDVRFISLSLQASQSSGNIIYNYYLDRNLFNSYFNI